ncbi:hypothetical protein TWF730_000562 [Orbilia blumenaviensis]|uniref:Azaphilone pigments biosynthesis cluster protein L N-terminal domain-containing protein n=1 Tax=Orbilia blumenaviensis TaxID=1796055 RepID=A0AAV9VPN0_9PEZI
MDPLSITAGVFSLLSSLAALSMKANDFCEEFQGAELEIRGLTEELNSLGSILKQLERNCRSISKSLVEDLNKILQQLNTTVIEIQLFLKSALGKRLRSPFWAFTGKKRCEQFLRRLEAYKSTLNITLTLASICSAQELHARGDEILSSIHNTQLALPETSTGDEYILQKYLTELETVYETSTAAGYSEDDTQTQVSVVPQTYKYLSGKGKLATLSENPSSSSEELNGPSFSPHPHPSTTIVHSRGAIGVEVFAKFWKSGKIEKREYLHPAPPGSSSEEMAAVQRENFAIWRRSEVEHHYGYIIRGTMAQKHRLASFELRTEDYWPEEKNPDVKIGKREIVGLAFSDDEGSLVAVLSRENSTPRKEYSIISWEAGADELAFKRWYMVRGFPALSPSLSPDGRFFAFRSHRQVQIFETKINRHLGSFKLDPHRNLDCQFVWSRNYNELLAFSRAPDGYAANAMIKIYQTSTESIIFSATLQDLGFQYDNFYHYFDFEFSGLDNKITIATSGPEKSSIFRRIMPAPKNASEISRGQTFWGSINLDDKTVSIKHVDKTGKYNYFVSAYAGDGSYVFRYSPWNDKLQLVGFNSNSGVQFFDDVEVEAWDYCIVSFDNETNRMFFLISDRDSVGMVFWEPKS